MKCNLSTAQRSADGRLQFGSGKSFGKRFFKNCKAQYEHEKKFCARTNRQINVQTE